VGDVLEHVEPRHALVGQQLRGVRFGLLQDGRANVAGLDLGPLRALHVQHRGLQHAAERRRLRWLTLLASLRLLDRVAQVGVEITPQLRQIDAARRQDALALVVVRQRVEQMLERDVGMSPRDRLAVGDRQQYFNRRGEHRGSPWPRYSSSIVARSGNSAWRAIEVTVSTFVSATSHG
jgi:hypothetical protein